MRKKYGRSLLLTSSVLVGAISLPLLVSCGFGEGKTTTKDSEGTGGKSTDSASETTAKTQWNESDSQSASHSDMGKSEEKSGTTLDVLISLYKELGKGLFEQQRVSDPKINVLSQIVDDVAKLRESYEKLLKAKNEIKGLKSQIRIAESELDLASENNYRLGKEIILYLLGFKFIWGAFTGYAPSTSTTLQTEKLEATMTIVKPKLEMAMVKLEDAKQEMKQLLEKVVEDFNDSITILGTTLGGLDPSLRRRLASSKFAFINVVSSLLDTEEEYTERYEMLLQRFMFSNFGVPTQITERDDSVDLKAIGNFERTNYLEVKAKLLALRSKFMQLTQVLPSPEEKDSEFVKLSPAVILSEIESDLSTMKTNSEQLKNQVEEQETLVTEEEKSMVDNKIGSIADEIKKLQKANELLSKKLSVTFGAAKTLSTLAEKAQEVFMSFSSASTIKSMIFISADKLLQADSNLRSAMRDKVSFFRELGLYTFGFKLFWGYRTGYAPTVNVKKEEMALSKAKEEFEKESKDLVTKLRLAMNEFEAKLNAFDTLSSSILDDKGTDQLTKQVTRVFRDKFKKLLGTLTTKQAMLDTKKEETIKVLGIQDESSLGNPSILSGILGRIMEESKYIFGFTKGGFSLATNLTPAVSMAVTPREKNIDYDSLTKGMVSEQKELTKDREELERFIRSSSGGIISQFLIDEMKVMDEIKSNLSQIGILQYVSKKLSHLIGREDQIIEEMEAVEEEKDDQRQEAKDDVEDTSSTKEEATDKEEKTTGDEEKVTDEQEKTADDEEKADTNEQGKTNESSDEETDSEKKDSEMDKSSSSKSEDSSESVTDESSDETTTEGDVSESKDSSDKTDSSSSESEESSESSDESKTSEDDQSKASDSDSGESGKSTSDSDTEQK